MTKSQHGFGHITLLLLIVVLAVAAFAGWRVLNGRQSKMIGPAGQAQTVSEEKLLWKPDDSGGWQPAGKVPACAEPVRFKMPVDLSKATTVLYPGQVRGGEYKAHGGFRFDNSANNEISVIAPMDGFAVKGARYLASGQIQYVFDFINNCGITWRFGHLLKLTPALDVVADKFPEPRELDSRDHSIEPPVFIKKGEKIATAVGVTVNGRVNTFVDWGVYDLRKTNWAWENDSKYRNGPGSYWGQKGRHAVCWFDMLAPADTQIIKGLPAADKDSGARSDYCR